ncbi:MAG: tRNA (adenosine(37)-N6)-threonylcarbamoyltransferase complex dimerization subunit type 1 TsaB [Geobacter sp.]|nr:tRNA (adenosine(37)-N6)-threonylcarbamoyltransferase complex dimerization subunit type 1 TsaB [Geobacter sp.]
MPQRQSVGQIGDICTSNGAALNILAIDSSTSMATVALSVGHKIVAESIFSTDRTLSARLIPEIERLVALGGLSLSDIDLFAASVGPGSFTGVRGGVATMQGLALAGGKPCIGYSSLAMLAMNFSLCTYPVCPMLDARKSEIYSGLYDCSASIPQSILKDCVMPPADFLELVFTNIDQPVIFAGDGAQRYQEEIVSRFGSRATIAPFQLHNSRAANGAMLALDGFRRAAAVAPSMLLPVYLRASEAEINRKSKLQANRVTE